MGQNPRVRFAVGLVIALALAGAARADDRTPVTLGAALAGARKAPRRRSAGPDIAAAEARRCGGGAWPNPACTSARIGSPRASSSVRRAAAGVRHGWRGQARRRGGGESRARRGRLALRDLRHRVVVAWIELARAGGDVDRIAVAAQQAAELETHREGPAVGGHGRGRRRDGRRPRRARGPMSRRRPRCAREDAASAELAGGARLGSRRVPLRADGAPVDRRARTDLAALRAALAHIPSARRRRRASRGGGDAATRCSPRRPRLALEGEVDYDDPTMTGRAPTRCIGTDAHVALALELPLFAHIGDRVRAARATVAAERSRLAATEAELAGAARSRRTGAGRRRPSGWQRSSTT